MSQKSSVPQAVSFVSQVLKRDIQINLAASDRVSHTSRPADFSGIAPGYVRESGSRDHEGY
jgi:hypothetical protein